MQWDPQQYARYAEERGRPFLDLTARIRARTPRRVVDLGCGPGTLTALLAQRWPAARVHGLDSSPEMIARAEPSPHLSFEVGDVMTWSMPADADVVVSNATLQWVPEHRDLLTRWAAALPDDGWLAFQVPGNFDAPSHTLMRELAESPRWAGTLAGVLRHRDAVGTASDYARLLIDLRPGLAPRPRLEVDAWETTYVHVLTGQDPVLEWVRGTGLRPVLAALDDADAAEFEAQYATSLRAAYPRVNDMTLFPFRRIFVVAHRAG